MKNIRLFKDRKGVTSIIGVTFFLVILLTSFFMLIMIQYSQSQYQYLTQDMKNLDREREDEKLSFYRVGFDDYIPSAFSSAQGVGLVAGDLKSLWKDDNNFLTFSSAAGGGFTSGEYEPADGGELGDTTTIAGGYSNLTDRDASYWQMSSSASAGNTTLTYNPSGYNLLGGTTLVSGSISDLQADDGTYMTFRSVNTATNIEDYVDNNTSDVDSSANKGSHSNFANQQTGPDSQYDILTEGNTGSLAMEWGTVSVSDTFTTVNLVNTYESPVIVCAPEYSSGVPRTVRLRNVDSSSFDVRGQNPSGTTCPTTTAHYIVMEEGVWSLPDGTKVEASKYDTSTVGENNNWLYDQRTYNQTYSGAIIVLHQVMSYNDATWITTYCSKWSSRTDPPSSADSGFRIALNGAEAVDSHGAETIGYIVIEQNQGTIGGVKYDAKSTTNSVQGFDDSPPYNTIFSQSFSSAPDIVVSTLLEMDGSNGGWCIDYTITQINCGLAVDEDQEYDSERSHISETCGFWAFETSGSIDLRNYEADLEVQWTSVNHDEVGEYLCIYTGSLAAENLRVDYWTGSSWTNLFTNLTQNTWNNISVPLTSTTFTIRFNGGTETGDITQDSWQIDAVLLHIWADQYTVEVEFIGSSNTADWRQLVWKADSAWTLGSVDVTLQLYNYTLGGYPTNGNGYISYTSSSTPNTDEEGSKTVSTNSTNFRDGSGNWKMKVTGTKYTTTQFDWKGDLVELEVTQPSGDTTDWYADFYAPVQGLYNLTIEFWGNYTQDNVTQTIYAYNYHTAQYDSINSTTYTTAYSGQWHNTTLTTDASYYTSNGKIRVRTAGECTIDSFDVYADYLHLNETHYTEGAINWYAKIPVNQTASEIDRFDVAYGGHFSSEADITLYIYNVTADGWDELTTATASTTDTIFGPLPVNGSDAQHYINPSQEVWISVNSTSSQPYYCYADHLYVKVYPTDFTPSWWDAKYHYRKQITISNNAASTLEEGYSVELIVNTSSLVSASKMVSNGSDLRIVWWNSTASNWVELDRHIIDVNIDSTQIWFKTQSEISSSEEDSNYFIYYGNPYAQNPPANGSNVYLWFDDFETDTRSQYSIGKHATNWHGANAYTNFQYDSENERVTYDTGDDHTGGIMPDISEDDVYAEMKMGVTDYYPSHTTQGILIRWQSNDVFYGVKACGGGYTPRMGIVENSRTTDLASNDTAYHPMDGSTFRWGVATWGSNIKMWYGDTTYTYQVWASTTDPSISTAGKIDFLAAQSIGWMDDLLIRKYIDPEPSTSLGGEETTWIGYILLKITNEGNTIVHLENLMVIDDANHNVTSLEAIYISPKETWSYQTRYSWVSDATYTVKAVSDRGNLWSYTTTIR